MTKNEQKVKHKLAHHSSAIKIFKSEWTGFCRMNVIFNINWVWIKYIQVVDVFSKLDLIWVTKYHTSRFDTQYLST